MALEMRRFYKVYKKGYKRDVKKRFLLRQKKYIFLKDENDFHSVMFQKMLAEQMINKIAQTFSDLICLIIV